MRILNKLLVSFVQNELRIILFCFCFTTFLNTYAQVRITVSQPDKPHGDGMSDKLCFCFDNDETIEIKLNQNVLPKMKISSMSINSSNGYTFTFEISSFTFIEENNNIITYTLSIPKEILPNLGARNKMNFLLNEVNNNPNTTISNGLISGIKEKVFFCVSSCDEELVCHCKRKIRIFNLFEPN